ncbi:LysR family transcriptional regulator [Alteromonas sp. CYL-A6]|uniref:LysR family transcriptional regulator n=1 Tax=Alteromonas nitratireducens TaxID=3390813 RepID=UPI0034BA4C52
MINPVWLRTFCTLAETRHFTRTASYLHMTQSGVSQHLKKLEEAYGECLLERTSKTMTLTSAGEQVYREAQRILLALSGLEGAARHDKPYAGSVHIMSPGSVGLAVYPHLLSVQSSHPELVIDYRFAPNSDIQRAVESGRADIGLMTHPPESARLSYAPLATEALRLVTPHSMTAATWDNLMELGFIGHPDGEHHANLLLGANFHQYRHVDQFPRRGFSNQIHLILEPVARGLGFTVLPAHAIDGFSAQESIRVHSLRTPVEEPLYHVYRVTARPSVVVSRVMQHISELLSPSA